MDSKIKTPTPALTRHIIRPSRKISEKRADTLLWLDKNENCDPEYTQLIYHALHDFPNKALYTYPDCSQLYQKLSLHLKVDINELFIASGSDGVIRNVYETFVAPGDTVLYTEPTFAMYAIYAQMFGAHSHLIHYQASASGPTLSADKLIHAIYASRPKLIGLPNPNSPTGTVFEPDVLITIIEAAENVGAIILIDEAYYPFYPSTMLPSIKDYRHLMIARTFSKAFGAAGIRIGYGVAHQDLIAECQKMRPMYEAGALSILLAERLLDFEQEMLASVKRLNAGKAYFLEEMQQLGLRTHDCEGNFLHVAFGDDADAVFEALKNIALFRATFTHPSLLGFSRFTATTRELFKPLVDIIRPIIKG